jgi:hypothetical protein
VREWRLCPLSPPPFRSIGGSRWPWATMLELQGACVLCLTTVCSGQPANSFVYGCGSYAAGSSIDTSKARELTATSRPSGRSQLLNLDITPIGRQTANKGHTQHVSMRPIASNLVCNQSSIPHKYVWQTTIRPNHIPGLVLKVYKTALSSEVLDCSKTAASAILPTLWIAISQALSFLPQYV